MKPLALDLCCGMGGWTHGLVAAGWDVIGFDVTDWGYEAATGQKLLIGDVREARVIPGDGIYFGALKAVSLKGRKVSLVTASPPCQEFSYRSFPFKRCRVLRDTVPPNKSIWEACVRIAKEAKAPLIIENVRGAEGINYKHPEWFMGKADSHYGSFYLWGDVPALIPIGRPVKGFKRVDTTYTGGKKFQGQGIKGKDGNPSDTYGAFGHSKFPGEMEREGGVPRKRDSFHADGERGHKVRFEEMPHSSHSSHSSARKAWSAKAAMIPIELGRWIGECFHPENLPRPLHQSERVG